MSNHAPGARRAAGGLVRSRPPVSAVPHGALLDSVSDVTLDSMSKPS